MLFPELVKVVMPMVDKLASLKWGTLARHQPAPTFFKQNKDLCSMIFLVDALDKLILAGENYLETEPQTVLQLAQIGLLGEHMFSMEIRHIVEKRLAKAIADKLQELELEVVGKKPSAIRPSWTIGAPTSWAWSSILWSSCPPCRASAWSRSLTEDRRCARSR